MSDCNQIEKIGRRGRKESLLMMILTKSTKFTKPKLGFLGPQGYLD